MLVGNKHDKPLDEKRQQTKAEADIFATQNQVSPPFRPVNRTRPLSSSIAFLPRCQLVHLESSARTGHHVEQIFVELAQRMPEPTTGPALPDGLSLQPAQAKKKDGCC